MEIRLAKISERRVLEALQWRAALNNPGDRQALLANPDAIEIPMSQIEQGFVFVAEEESYIHGFAGILERPDGNIELDALFVEPVSWKKGIGRALVDYCASFALAKGANYLHVVGNPHAEGFYLACGFMVIGTEKTRFGSGLLMKKALPASTK